jgi:glycerophosphoryl diester phosphodiesterase
MFTFASKITRLLQTQSKFSLVTKAPYAKNPNRPLNIAHRGCAGLFPENTIPSF